MENDLNVRQLWWKTTSMEDNVSGKQHQWKTNSMEYEINVRQPQSKMTTLVCLASQFCSEFGPAQPQLVQLSIGNFSFRMHPYVGAAVCAHSYYIIIIIYLKYNKFIHNECLLSILSLLSNCCTVPPLVYACAKPPVYFITFNLGIDFPCWNTEWRHKTGFPFSACLFGQ